MKDDEAIAGLPLQGLSLDREAASAWVDLLSPGQRPAAAAPRQPRARVTPSAVLHATATWPLGVKVPGRSGVWR